MALGDSNSRLTDIFRRNRDGAMVGVYSVCSAHPLVIRAALELARDRGQLAVIEATCNQVNQDGGYTGMTPRAFAALVTGMAVEVGLPADDLVLGGDHLGPQPWRRRDCAEKYRSAGNCYRPTPCRILLQIVGVYGECTIVNTELFIFAHSAVRL